MDFTLNYHWSERPRPVALDEETLEGYDPLWVTLARFNSSYQGELTVPLEGGKLTFWFEDDLAIVFDQIPDWLTRLARQDGDATLLFGSQGTELKLVAERRGEVIVLSAVSISPDRTLPPTVWPLAVQARHFLLEWRSFLLAVLDALVKVDPALGDDPGYRRYRASIATL